MLLSFGNVQSYEREGHPLPLASIRLCQRKGDEMNSLLQLEVVMPGIILLLCQTNAIVYF